MSFLLALLLVSFEEVPASKSGIGWVHDNAMSPQHYLPETLGPGLAFLDYDNDGWMDIYLVNSGRSDFYRPTKPLRNALYRNNQDGTFTDVTAKAGVEGGSFGMGVAVGDYDNDGYADLFVTAYGKSTLYHNNRDGTFRDVTEESGVRVSDWTTSAVFFDYDNDSLLDLFTVSFVEFGVDKHVNCGSNKQGKPYYCIPKVFQPSASHLFRNNGDGTFRDVTDGSAIAQAAGKGNGVVATDINNDGWMDLFVANDTVQNFLFINREGTFEEFGLAAEVALSANGQARSGMGVDAADFDNDGYQDLFVANIDQEMFSLYKNNGDEMFTDVALAHGIGQATRYLSGWGLRFADFDNDGLLDLFLANGHPDDMIETVTPNVTYREALLLFRHDGTKLRDVSATAGPVFRKRFAARGLAAGDFDNDGRVDILVGINGGAPVLLRNTTPAANNWAGIRLAGTTANRDAVGARVTWSAGGVRRSMLKRAGGSFMSDHDNWLVLGLVKAKEADWVEVRWPAPSNLVERFVAPAGRYTTLVEGEGMQQ
ncbi:MAG: CRTAC1 family protein [Bryobacteraceae bacterium]